MFDSLARRRRVILPTHPGFDGAGPVGWLDRVTDLANYYLDFLDTENLSNVHLVGLSLGGWIAAELAVRNSTRLASLTLVGAQGIYLDGVEPLDIFLRNEEQCLEDLFASTPFAEQVKTTALDPAGEDRRLHNRITAAKLTWRPRFYDPELRKWLHRIKVPTAIVWGENDRFLPVDYAFEWGRLIPDSRVHVIPGCGHAIQIEAAEQLADIIETHFTQAGAPA